MNRQDAIEAAKYEADGHEIEQLQPIDLSKSAPDRPPLPNTPVEFRPPPEDSKQQEESQSQVPHQSWQFRARSRRKRG